MKKIAVIDYGMSNLHSVVKSLESVTTREHQVYIAKNDDELSEAYCLVLPGQGAAGSCVNKLTQRFPEIRTKIKNRPFMGICMGFQVLFDYSEEDKGIECLSVIKGNVKSFSKTIKNNLKVPHMGWNKVLQKNNHPIWSDIPNNAFFYFVHSYYAQCQNKDLELSTSSYEISFTSSVLLDNIFACQFHPEKSSKYGLQLISNFLKWAEEV